MRKRFHSVLLLLALFLPLSAFGDVASDLAQVKLNLETQIANYPTKTNIPPKLLEDLAHINQILGSGSVASSVTVNPNSTTNAGSVSSTTSGTPNTITVALTANSSRQMWLLQSDPANTGNIELLNSGVPFFVLLPGAAYTNTYPERIITGDISVRSSVASQKYAGFQN